MEKNTLVQLKTFWGTLKPKNKIRNQENYWKLIGEKGIVMADSEFNPNKVLVKFEKNLDDFDLENHNPLKNSLYIDLSDLDVLHEP